MVVVFGTVCLDRILRVARLPGHGGYVEIDDEVLMLGGEAANTALALQTWERAWNSTRMPSATGPMPTC